jgi:peptidoglycan endopeptidase LytE
VVAVDTNPPPVDTNPPVIVPPVVSNPPPVVVAPPVEPTGTEYVIVKGDTLGKIARRNGITLKELEAANPDLIPTKLKVGHKILIPAGGGGTSDASAMDSTAAVGAGGEVYVVKSGDNLSKIAKRYGTTVKEIQSENNLVTTKIKVGQKLNIPAKAEVAAPVEAEPAAPVTPAPIAPVTPPGTTSAN